MTDLLGRKMPNGRASKGVEKQQPVNGVKKHDDGEPEEAALRDIWLINTLNETLAASWDLEQPSQKERTKVVRHKRLVETVSPLGDRRVRVNRRDFAPNGKYRAICKIFMGYAREPETQYIGTGWLIADDILVTAGHCLYDPAGGPLKWIKAFIGFVGPESKAKNDPNCEMRLGKVAALPAEYIKAQTVVHDVGFIKLDKPFSQPKIFEYKDTPSVASGIELGVVGYPGDVDGGDNMYEHWANSKINLSRTGYLSYKIDTEGGESGSPVLKRARPGKGLDVPIGVHVQGGYPNSGSVIGPLGNIFSEYVKVLHIKHSKGKLPTGVTKIPTSQSLGVREFEFVRLPASGSTSSGSKDTRDYDRSEGSDEQADIRSHEEDEDEEEEAEKKWEVEDGEEEEEEAKKDEDEDYESEIPSSPNARLTEAKKALDRLQGKPSQLYTIDMGGTKIQVTYEELQKLRSQLTSGKKIKAALSTQRPEKLPARFWRESGPLPDPASAVSGSDPKNQDIQTTYMINFPPELDGEGAEVLKKIKKSVGIWQAWTSSMCEQKLQQKIDSREIPADNAASSVALRGSYRSMIFDFILRGSTWFAKTYDEVQTRTISCTKAEFHMQLISTVLAGFAVPSSVFSKLEVAMQSLSDGILKISKDNKQESIQYWIMLTRYDYDHYTKTVQPVIRVINFKTDSSTSEYTVGKSKVSSINMKFVFNQYQCDFNYDIFSKLEPSISGEQVRAGEEFIGRLLSLNVDVPKQVFQQENALSKDLGNVVDDLVRQRRERDIQDLMEDYDEYTGLLALIRIVIRNMDGYSQSLSTDSIDIAIESLFSAQASMREEQDRIVNVMSQMRNSEASPCTSYTPPSQWRRRLPISKTKFKGVPEMNPFRDNFYDGQSRVERQYLREKAAHSQNILAILSWPCWQIAPSVTALLQGFSLPPGWSFSNYYAGSWFSVDENSWDTSEVKLMDINPKNLHSRPQTIIAYYTNTAIIGLECVYGEKHGSLIHGTRGLNTRSFAVGGKAIREVAFCAVEMDECPFVSFSLGTSQTGKDDVASLICEKSLSPDGEAADRGWRESAPDGCCLYGFWSQKDERGLKRIGWLYGPE